MVSLKELSGELLFHVKYLDKIACCVTADDLHECLKCNYNLSRFLSLNSTAVHSNLYQWSILINTNIYVWGGNFKAKCFLHRNHSLVIHSAWMNIYEYLMYKLVNGKKSAPLQQSPCSSTMYFYVFELLCESWCTWTIRVNGLLHSMHWIKVCALPVKNSQMIGKYKPKVSLCLHRTEAGVYMDVCIRVKERMYAFMHKKFCFFFFFLAGPHQPGLSNKPECLSVTDWATDWVMKSHQWSPKLETSQYSRMPELELLNQMKRCFKFRCRTF